MASVSSAWPSPLALTVIARGSFGADLKTELAPRAGPAATVRVATQASRIPFFFILEVVPDSGAVGAADRVIECRIDVQSGVGLGRCDRVLVEHVVDLDEGRQLVGHRVAP